METVKAVLYILRDHFETYCWLVPLVAEAVCLLHSQKLLQGRSTGQKSICLSLIGIACLLLAFHIKDFTLGSGFAGVQGGYILHLAVKLLLAMALVWLAVLAVKRLLDACESEKIQTFINRNKFGLLLFAVLFVPILWKVDTLDAWTAGWYAVDYSMGPGSRFFIGTVCRLLFGSYLTQAEIKAFIYGAELLVSVCLAGMGNMVYRQAEEATRPAAAFVSLCLACSPVSPSAMFAFPLFGRLELYDLLLCLAAVLLFCKIKNTWLKYGLIAAAGCACNAIYQGFMFLYLPLLLMPMIQDIFGGTRHPLRRLGAAVIACLPIGASFLFFQFFSSVNFSGAGEMLQALQKKTALTLVETPLYYELFAPFSTAFNDTTVQFWFGGELPLDSLVRFSVLMLPVIILAAVLYHSCFAQLRARHISKWKTPYPYFLLTLLTVLPQYMLNVDWGRWTIALGTDLFFGILYLFYTDNEEMSQAMRRLAGFLKKRPAAAVLTLLYLASLGQVTQSAVVPAVSGLKKWF